MTGPAGCVVCGRPKHSGRGAVCEAHLTAAQRERWRVKKAAQRARRQIASGGAVSPPVIRPDHRYNAGERAGA